MFSVEKGTPSWKKYATAGCGVLCAIASVWDLLQIMTPLCIFPVHTCDERRPLSNIAGLTFKTTLQSWKWFLLPWDWIDHFQLDWTHWCIKLHWTAMRFNVQWDESNSVTTHRDTIGHLHVRRRCLGLGSPASHRSNCHGTVCRGMGMSCLKCFYWSSNIFSVTRRSRSDVSEWVTQSCFVLTTESLSQ